MFYVRELTGTLSPGGHFHSNHVTQCVIGEMPVWITLARRMVQLYTYMALAVATSRRCG
uniref:Uncharacterized protein n=1 Tax=Arundo donax TaxID=35708 RepID=A0A0A9CFW8_ARUDO